MCRMPWRVRKADVEYFQRELWKDLRPFPRATLESEFGKDCFTREDAYREASALTILRDRLGAIAPRPIRVDGSLLILEKVSGGRLFDVLRHLRTIEASDPSLGAASAADALLGNAVERLRRLQLELLTLGPICSTEPYPLEAKVKSLLEMFMRVLGITHAPSRWLSEVADLSAYWESECSVIPFRDATTKNILVGESSLTLRGGEDADHDQCAAVRDLLVRSDAAHWAGVDLIDVDFSSIVHLTSPEDDPISLLWHEATAEMRELNCESLILDAALGPADPLRAATTLFVRYLRFGGRKLAYQLINAQGFKVRFAYDNPLFYFERAPLYCDALSKSFAGAYPGLLEILELIRRALQHATVADRELLRVDHLRRYVDDNPHYWQQNPGELV